ncbi:glutathione S-transferase family protein [Pseudoalteromonas fenneropenaei]|uniref:Glutathione S-transferase family protein n=1 Tax=Pseudoalteromonas fenneropenaei TaxID=1737459 RepID=A0ABV7CLI4_9GAMM
MANYKVTYFDVNGGRAEPIRLALFIGGIAFEDERFGYAEFPEVKKRMPLAQVPVLTLDGQQITQSSAILRYVGRLAELYPQDAYQALLCDEIIDSIEDVTGRIVMTFGLQGDALKEARGKLVDNYLLPHLQWLTQKLEGKTFFVEERLTIADLKTLAHLSWLNSGLLDHIDKTLVAEHAPVVQQYVMRLQQHPQIVKYYQQRA